MTSRRVRAHAPGRYSGPSGRQRCHWVGGLERPFTPPALSMCNLYSITTNQAAIVALFRVVNRYVGNLPPMPGVFPDYPAPVVRNAGAERELTMMRWGMPPPPESAGRR